MKLFICCVKIPTITYKNTNTYDYSMTTHTDIYIYCTTPATPQMKLRATVRLWAQVIN